MTHYQKTIVEVLGEGDYEPRHVEAWMRVEHPTLDHLSRDQFAALAREAHGDVLDAGAELSERLAKSVGL